MYRRTFTSAIILALLSAPVLLGCKAAAPDAPEVTTPVYTQTIYLVRHAEKLKVKDDPGLTDAGHARAALMRDMLRDKGVTHIHSSDYLRTRDTAAPLAKALGMDVQIYDASNLPAIADKVRSMPGVHLVVGHSNTTPQLTALLTGDPEELMPETEYDRFTTVNLGADGKMVNWSIERFGE